MSAFYTKKRYLYFFLFLVLTLLSRGFFYSLSIRESNRFSASVKALLISEYKQANSMLISRSLSQLEKIGIIKCVKLTELNLNNRVFYNTSLHHDCSHFGLLKNMVEINLTSTGGQDYILSFEDPHYLKLIWTEIFVIIFLALVLVFIFYRQHMIHKIAQIQSEINFQVAHDIKSPLAALEIVMDDIKDLPEDSRELTLNAIHRIQEIAHNLSHEGSKTSDKKKVCLISETLEQIINEKRYEYKSYKELEIFLDDKTNYFNFIDVDATELGRVISNLINNSVEALNFKGKITVSLEKTDELLFLQIKDNGDGFPESILNKEITRGNTQGKDNGQGLGLFHAYETVLRANGKLSLENNDGAVVNINIPIGKAPIWLKESIDLSGVQKIVVIDDDRSIYDLWKKVFIKNKVDKDLLYLGSEKEIFDHFKDVEENTYYLIDNDLRMSFKGIDLIVNHRPKNVIIVSSEYESEELQEKCLQHKISILPKVLVNKIVVK